MRRKCRKESKGGRKEWKQEEEMWEGPEIQMKTCKQTNTFVNSDVSDSLFVLDVFNLFLFSLHDKCWSSDQRRL